MSRRRSLSYGAAAILHAVGSGHCFGFDIIDTTGLTSGTVYPTLERLEEAGLLRSRWENADDAHRDGRPARRYFTLTARGREALNAALEKYKALRPIPSVSRGDA
ncbi:MAG TPA: PadR family transcriptional regulator [Vicinamibacterales bacterium]|jgi:PadR family transcriptional regulator PadR|nr:PadR family transcriptional regulator [Vicinamibacterales bacterium]